MSQSERIAVTYMFSRECPSHVEGRALLLAAAERVGCELDLVDLEVTTDAQAEALDFPGSPTYLVAGRDIAAHDPDTPRRTEVCRAYVRGDGRIGPLPALDDLVDALRAAPRSQESAA